MWYIYLVKFYSDIKSNEISWSSIKYMQLENHQWSGLVLENQICCDFTHCGILGKNKGMILEECRDVERQGEK